MASNLYFLFLARAPKLSIWDCQWIACYVWDIVKYIEGHEKVEAYFGYWPKFCDARIEKFSLDSVSKSVAITVYYIDSDQGKEGRISLVFNNTFDIQISDCLDQNIVGEILITKINLKYKVGIEACYGLNGEFWCESMSVSGTIEL